MATTPTPLTLTPSPTCDFDLLLRAIIQIGTRQNRQLPNGQTQTVSANLEPTVENANLVLSSIGASFYAQQKKQEAIAVATKAAQTEAAEEFPAPTAPSA